MTGTRPTPYFPAPYESWEEAAAKSAAGPRCRLCSGQTVFAYRLRLLDKYEVDYFRCMDCESLQTQEPFWLQEAYGNAECQLDPGAVQRCLYNFALTLIVGWLFHCRRMLDYGGGAGLLCRLLRDRRKDAYSFDRYSSLGYATGFGASPRETFDLVTAFEVIEHFSNPMLGLKEIFEARPRVVLATSELFTGQGPDWWYLAPTEGQHVFIFSEKALHWTAARFGYQAVLARGFFLFSREKLGAISRFTLRHLIRSKLVRLIRIIALARESPGVQHDLWELVTRRAGNSRANP
jgi:hypothetical protein